MTRSRALATGVTIKMDKEEVAVIGSGPAGMVAAFALHSDEKRKFNVTLFEMVNLHNLSQHPAFKADRLYRARPSALTATPTSMSSLRLASPLILMFL